MSHDESPVSDMTVRELDQKLTRMRDELRIELRGYVDEKFVTRADFELRMTRLTLEVVREVSGTLKAMVTDAMREVATEAVHTFVEGTDFPRRIHEVLDARRARDRQERVEDFRKAIGGLGRVIAFVNPLLSMLLAIIAIWAVFIR